MNGRGKIQWAAVRYNRAFTVLRVQLTQMKRAKGPPGNVWGLSALVAREALPRRHRSPKMHQV